MHVVVCLSRSCLGVGAFIACISCQRTGRFSLELITVVCSLDLSEKELLCCCCHFFLVWLSVVLPISCPSISIGQHHATTPTPEFSSKLYRSQ